MTRGLGCHAREKWAGSDESGDLIEPQSEGGGARPRSSSCSPRLIPFSPAPCSTTPTRLLVKRSQPSIRLLLPTSSSRLVSSAITMSKRANGLSPAGSPPKKTRTDLPSIPSVASSDRPQPAPAFIQKINDLLAHEKNKDFMDASESRFRSLDRRQDGRRRGAARVGN